MTSEEALYIGLVLYMAITASLSLVCYFIAKGKL